MIESLVSAFALDEIGALLCASSAENYEAHGARHLHRRGADSAARAVHQDRFGSMRFRGVMQRIIRGRVRNPNARALAEVDFRGKRMHLLFQRQCILRVSARDGFRGVDPVTRFHFLDAFTDRLNHPGGIRSRSVGKRRLDCISSGAHVRVVGIHARRMNAHEHLPGPRLRCRDFLKFELFRPAKLTNEDGFHFLSPIISSALL